MTDDNHVVAQPARFIGERIGRIVGIEADAGLALPAGRERLGESVGRLPRPGLAAVDNARDAHAAPPQKIGQPLHIGPAPLAQGPVGVALLGKGISVLHHVEFHVSNLALRRTQPLLVEPVHALDRAPVGVGGSGICFAGNVQLPRGSST